MAKKVHTSEQITTFLAELEKQTDRGAALIAAAVLDEILEILLAARLLEVGRDRHDALFGRGKPLDSFAVKIELGFALGLFTNAARIQLGMIREVRNKFAHRIEPLQFDHPDIAKEITSRPLQHMPKGQSVRQQFLSIFASLSAILYGTASADIRIRSLEQTHTALFRAMAQAVIQIEAERKKKSLQDSDPPLKPDQSKP
jgi:hypothetical protein